MMKPYDAAAIGALLRRRGLPTQPVVGVPVTEIRSDTFLGNIDTLDGAAHPTALGGLVLEWSFQAPYHMVPEIFEFLTDNDVFIADTCKTAMKGVHYYGTYYGAVGQRASFRTIWGYDSWEAHDEWAKVLSDPKNKNLLDAVTKLRGYWLSDPNSSQEHLAYAANVDIAKHPFMSLSIAADKKP